jgi:hypothetical protein
MDWVAERILPKGSKQAVIGVSILTVILTRTPFNSTKSAFDLFLQPFNENGGEGGIRTPDTV